MHTPWKFRGRPCQLVGILGNSETNDVQYVMVNPDGLPHIIRVNATKRGFLPGLTIDTGNGNGRKPAHVSLFQQAPPKVVAKTPQTATANNASASNR